jgi:lipid-binding SYLF domain-containing protein
LSTFHANSTLTTISTEEGITSDAAAVNVHPDEKEKIEGDGSLTPNKQKQRKERRAIVKIPSKVINKAQGLAIFTTARMGFNLSGATGSGVLIARLPDGSWSPPSGIQVHALGAGFMIGVDIYDCVCVINSREALAAFMSTRVSLGPDVAVTAGPWGAGGMVDFGGTFQSADERKAAEAQKAQLEQQQKEDHVHEKPALGPDGTPLATDANDGLKPEKPKNKRSSSVSLKPVFTYVKSRGFYAGVQVDGTIITERKDANASFYGHRVSVEQILRGEVQPGGAWSAGVRPLFDALRVAETQQALPDANMPAPPPVGTQSATATPGLAAQQGPAGQALGTQVPGQQHHMSGAGPSQGGEALPGYQDDGVHRPGVGDNKTQYA